MRIVLFNGRAAGERPRRVGAALRIARSGLKTLVDVYGPAHSLADRSTSSSVPTRPRSRGNLWAEQIDSQRRPRRTGARSRSTRDCRARRAGLNEIEAEELSVIPGLAELFSLADVKTHYEEGPYDVLIVDCAPTGETLRLLSLPDIIQWYMEKIFPVERRVMGALRPVARRLTSLPLPDDNVYAAVRRFYDRLEGVRRVLTEGETSVRSSSTRKNLIADSQPHTPPDRSTTESTR